MTVPANIPMIMAGGFIPAEGGGVEKDTDWVIAGDGANDASVGSTAWLSPVRVSKDDGSYAIDAGGISQSNYLVGEDFRFSVPESATIRGIEVRYQYRSPNSSGLNTTTLLKLRKPDLSYSSGDEANAFAWIPTSPTNQDEGSASNLWGESWTPDDINDEDFGFAMSVTNAHASAKQVDAYWMKVHYTTGSGAHPIVEGTHSDVTSSSATPTINMPPGIEADDIVIVEIALNDNTNVITWPTDWSEVINESSGGLTVVARFKATGSLTSIGLTLSIAGKTAYIARRISGAADPATQEPEGQTATATSTTSDPPSITPTGGSKDYTIIAGSGAGITVTASAWPTNYYSMHNQEASAGAADCSIWSAVRQVTASSENPGVFTQTNCLWGAYTIAIHPA